MRFQIEQFTNRFHFIVSGVEEIMGGRILLPLTGLLAALAGVGVSVWTGALSVVRLSIASMVAIDMELGARFVHRDLWHTERLWFVHASHHGLQTTVGSRPGASGEKLLKKGVFEANDLFAITFAAMSVPVFAVAAEPPSTLLKNLSFGLAFGVTLYGFAYFLGHDLVAHGKFVMQATKVKLTFVLQNVEAINLLNC